MVHCGGSSVEVRDITLGLVLKSVLSSNLNLPSLLLCRVRHFHLPEHVVPVKIKDSVTKNCYQGNVMLKFLFRNSKTSQLDSGFMSIKQSADWRECLTHLDMTKKIGRAHV